MSFTITNSGLAENNLGFREISKRLHTVSLLLTPAICLHHQFTFGHSFLFVDKKIHLLWLIPPTSVTLLFLGLSKFHQEPSPQTVLAGGAARFECQIEGLPTPVITWEKDKLAVPEETRWPLFVFIQIYHWVSNIHFPGWCIHKVWWCWDLSSKSP